MDIHYQIIAISLHAFLLHLKNFATGLWQHQAQNIFYPFNLTDFFPFVLDLVMFQNFISYFSSDMIFTFCLEVAIDINYLIPIKKIW